MGEMHPGCDSAGTSQSHYSAGVLSRSKTSFPGSSYLARTSRSQALRLAERQRTTVALLSSCASLKVAHAAEPPVQSLATDAAQDNRIVAILLLVARRCHYVVSSARSFGVTLEVFFSFLSRIDRHVSLC